MFIHVLSPTTVCQASVGSVASFGQKPPLRHTRLKPHIPEGWSGLYLVGIVVVHLDLVDTLTKRLQATRQTANKRVDRQTPQTAGHRQKACPTLGTSTAAGKPFWCRTAIAHNTETHPCYSTATNCLTASTDLLMAVGDYMAISVAAIRCPLEDPVRCSSQYAP